MKDKSDPFDLLKCAPFEVTRSKVDESKLTHEERLGLAYCRLNSWEWDEYIGPKPDGFDNMPNFTKGDMRSAMTKDDFIWPQLKLIEEEIGEEKVSKYHWLFNLGKTEEEWRKWYSSREKMKKKRADDFVHGGVVLNQNASDKADKAEQRIQPELEPRTPRILPPAILCGPFGSFMISFVLGMLFRFFFKHIGVPN